VRIASVCLLLALGASTALAKAHKKSKPAAKPKAPVAQPAKTPANPEVLFTFDDGPAGAQTQRVLELLDQHHIKAVFFVNGVHFMGTTAGAAKNREILKEEHDRGHYVGNHTVHHYFLCGKVYSLRAGSEIEDNANAIQAATGIRPELYRTPFGAHCPALAAVLKGLGIKHTGWDIDPEDWKVKNAKIITERVTGALGHLRGRAILLMHDIQGETVKALPNILDWLDKENAQREKDGRPVIKVLDYSYLLPERPLVPPVIDTLGRILVSITRRARLDMTSPPIRLWPSLAWFVPRV
jgi:peptidoglycan/xylan/chitin deacetylase (PgdA/CDA1 family)